MTEIIIDVIIILIVLVFIILGSRKGFVKSILEIAGILLSIMIAFSVSSAIADYTFENSIRPKVVESVSNGVDEKTESANESIDKIWNSLPTTVKVICGISKFDKNSLQESISDGSEQGAQDISTSIADVVMKPIVVSAIKFICCIILIIILFFIVKLLSKAMNKATNSTPLRRANKFLGGALGAVKGIILSYLLVYLFLLLIPIFGGSLFGVTVNDVSKTYIANFFSNISIF